MIDDFGFLDVLSFWLYIVGLSVSKCFWSLFVGT